MDWTVEVVDEFEPEFAGLAPEVQNEIAALVRLLRKFGPALRRPHCDTLNGSRYSNMKELRFAAAGGVGALPLRSIPNAGRFSWWPATRAGRARRGSTEC